MLTNRKAKREAKQLFQFCLVDDLIDEARVRQVAGHITTAGYRDCPAILSHFLRLVRLDQLTPPVGGHHAEAQMGWLDR